MGTKNINLLFATDIKSANDYGQSIYKGLESKIKNISYGVEIFWTPISNYNIIHIQWPEELFDWNEPSLNDLKSLEKRLNKLGNCKIISTRHNYYPHGRNTENFKKLYNLIYQYSDAIVHLGEKSLKEFSSIYKEKLNVVIYHPIYNNIPNNITHEIARNKFKIKKHKKVVLIFGALRNNEERDSIISLIKELRKSNIYILINRWDSKLIPVSLSNIIKNFRKYLKLLRLNLKSDVIIKNEFTRKSDIQYYFNAADLVLILRGKTLNSGNLILSYTFKKPVLAPKVGNITEIIEHTSNYTYESIEKDSLCRIIKEIFKKEELVTKGSDNYKFAIENWSIDSIVNQHYELYINLLNS